MEKRVKQQKSKKAKTWAISAKRTLTLFIPRPWDRSSLKLLFIIGFVGL